MLYRFLAATCIILSASPAHAAIEDCYVHSSLVKNYTTPNYRITVNPTGSPNVVHNKKLYVDALAVLDISAGISWEFYYKYGDLFVANEATKTYTNTYAIQALNAYNETKRGFIFFMDTGRKRLPDPASKWKTTEITYLFKTGGTKFGNITFVVGHLYGKKCTKTGSFYVWDATRAYQKLAKSIQINTSIRNAWKNPDKTKVL